MNEKTNNLYHNYDKKFNTRWKQVDSLILYRDPNFQFKSNVIILELDNCLIEHLATRKVYDFHGESKVKLLGDVFVQKILEKSQDESIVILSNQIDRSQLNLDAIKRKTYALYSQTKLVFMMFCATKEDKFAKPHTGLWRLLNKYFWQNGQINIGRALVISNSGGQKIERIMSNGDGKVSYSSDVDRMFAYNIGMKFQTIDEFLYPNKEIIYKWCNKTIEPELRAKYCLIYNKYHFNIMEKIQDVLINTKWNTLCIVVDGIYSSGKTRLSNEIKNQWNQYFGDNSMCEILDLSIPRKKRYTTCIKLINDRINVILDGKPDNYVEYSVYNTINNVPMIYIYINCSVEMARLFDHVKIEESTNNITFYRDYLFDVYASHYKAPVVDNIHSFYIVYYPFIELTKSLLYYRF